MSSPISITRGLRSPGSERPPPMTEEQSNWRRPAEEAGRLARLSPVEQDLIRVAQNPDLARWMDQMRALGGCSHPIYLAGSTTTFNAAGEVEGYFSSQNEPNGKLAVRCGNRRDSVCPSCSRLHSGDTWQLVKAGLSGGKGTPKTVGEKPRYFLTLTGPSFGAVHKASDADVCSPRKGICQHGVRRGCFTKHSESAKVVGSPICRFCYDYTGHVLWNANVGSLWKATTDLIFSRLASYIGIPRSELRKRARLSYAKVAEYQRRGLVHLHVVVRADGLLAEVGGSPSGGRVPELENAIRASVNSARIGLPYSKCLGEHIVRWGKQIDISFIGGSWEGVSEAAVSAYIAKYISKGTSAVGGLDSRVSSFAEIELAPVTEHVRALMGSCWRMGSIRELGFLRMRLWAHSLGYRGHVLTKSRRYSTTYGYLRELRETFKRGETEDADRKVSSWWYVGSGYSLAEQEIANQIRRELAVAREEVRDKRFRGAE